MKNKLRNLKNVVGNWLISLCQRIINFISRKGTNNVYNSLMPKDNIDISNYEDALDFAFSPNEKVRNIALMGTYGSGKSSIINTYASKHPEKKFLHISLARFDDNLHQNKNYKHIIDSKPDSSKKEEQKPFNESIANNDTLEIISINNILEGKILNQLIHQISPNKIKESRFNIKRTSNVFATILRVIAIFFVISTTMILGFEKWLKNFVEELKIIDLHFLISPTFKFIAIIACAIILIYFLFLLINKRFFVKNLKKVEVKNLLGIEIFDSETDSSFDKYLNEVIYLFENCDVDAIVFEDLDRYDITLIFEKLREINYLVNKNSKKDLRFFYLIKDNIFSTSDRSKFFDFIIPVVPVVDISNASSMLSKILKNANLTNEIDEHLINDISFYINDMRLLTNIVNEYLIYKQSFKLVSDKENSNKQFAMIVYKNLFPEDFHSLQAGFGYVYIVFKTAKLFFDHKKESIQKEIYDTKNFIKELKETFSFTLDELNSLYFPLNGRVNKIGTQDIPVNISRIDLVRQIINSSEPITVYANGTVSYLDASKGLREMQNNEEYKSRCETLQDTLNKKIQPAEDRVNSLTKELEFLVTKRLKDIFSTQENEDAFWDDVNNFYKKENGFINSVLLDRNYGLIKYLIRNGYINEDYSVYSSYFYSDDLSQTDRNFILSVHNGNSITPEYKLNNPKNVLAALNPSSFLLHSVNNFDLFECAITERKEELLRKWFNTLENQGEDGYKFVIDFWKSNRANRGLIKFINKLSPQWLETWVSFGLFSDIDFSKYIYQTVEYCDMGTLNILNNNDWITKKISSDITFLQSEISDIGKYCDELQSIGVKFKQLSGDYNQQVLNYVYKNNMYTLNYNNMELLLRLFNKIDYKEIQPNFFTYVFKNNDKPIASYLLDNIDTFITIIVENSTKKFRDDENTIINILNDPNISIIHKQKYVSLLSTKINNLARLEELDIMPTLLKHNAFKTNWRNLLTYYKYIDMDKEKISEELANAMSHATSPSILKFSKLNSFLSLDVADSFRIHFIQSKFFDKTQYKSILNEMGFHYKSFFIVGLETWQIQTLFELNIIQKNEPSYNFIKQNYKNLLLDFFFIGDAKKAFKLIDNGDITLDRAELLEILSDSRIDSQSALILMNRIDGIITIEGKKYLDDVVERIIQKHFNVDDLPWIFINYNTLGPKSKKSIIEYSKKNHTRIVNVAKTSKCMPSEIYAELLFEGLIDAQTIIELRKILNNKNFDLLCQGSHRPSFEDNSYNRIILDYFMENEWISSYKEVSDGKLRAYPKRIAS
ncbi:MAG: hypothetical protein IKJ59_06300 [Clostridia bacterium]|nr:hypothetical protein [Clostridia bacterium]